MIIRSLLTSLLVTLINSNSLAVQNRTLYFHNAEIWRSLVLKPYCIVTNTFHVNALNESCPSCKINPSTRWPVVQCATTRSRLPSPVHIKMSPTDTSRIESVEELNQYSHSIRFIGLYYLYLVFPLMPVKVWLWRGIIKPWFASRYKYWTEVSFDQLISSQDLDLLTSWIHVVLPV